MLNDIKVLLDIDIADLSKDNLLNIYVSRATTVIKNYMNNEKFTDEYIQTNFQDALIFLVENVYRNKGKEHIKSMTQGKRSVSYKDDSSFAITDDIKNLLPTPYAKMR